MRQAGIVSVFCIILLFAVIAKAAPPEAVPGFEAPPAGARSDTLFLFAAEGSGSFGSPGTDERGFTFDGPDGTAEKAGWFGVDRTAQEHHWHLASTDLCAGTGTDMSEAQPFDIGDTDNDFALWCGSLGNCNWADPDGYGNYWNQTVLLDLGAVSHGADIAVSFAYRTDYEGNGYDYLRLASWLDDSWELQWSDQTGGDRTYREAEVAIPAVEFDADNLRLAFTFRSDGAWSDQDGSFLSDLGAVWLDNIHVEQSEEEVFAYDFEVGQLPSEMHFEHGESAGDFAKLYEDLFQGDALPVNESFVWAFFDSMTSSSEAPEYDFGIVRGPPYLDNAIESPRLSVDANGQALSIGPATRIILSADIYMDMHIESLVFYAWEIGAVMSGSGDCDPVFQNDNTVYYGEERNWVTVTRDVTEDLHLSAGGAPWAVEAIVAQFAVVDMEEEWGNGWWGPRTQAPYFDNIHVILVEGDLTAAPAAPPVPVLSAHPNPFNPNTELRLILPEPGPKRVSIHDITGRRLITLLDEDLPAGEQRLSWNGRDAQGQALSSGLYLAQVEGRSSRASLKLMILK